jgi:hypothetical protein
VFEQGGSSGKAPMIDLSLSSDEENFITDTSRDAEFAKKLFGDLNRDILRPPGDGKVIIIDDSDNKKEALNEKTANTELVATSAAVNPMLTASAVADDATTGAKNDNSDDQGLDQEVSRGNGNGSGVSALGRYTEDQGAEASVSQGRPWFCIAIFLSPLFRGVGIVM